MTREESTRENLDKHHPSATMGPLQGRRPRQGRIDHGKLRKRHPLAAMGPLLGRRLCPGKNRPPKTRQASSIGNQGPSPREAPLPREKSTTQTKHHPLATMGPLHGRLPCPGKNRPRKPRKAASIGNHGFSPREAPWPWEESTTETPISVIHWQLWAPPREVPLPREESAMETSIKIIHRVK